MHEGMPTPQAEHKKLSALAGRWEAEETLFPSPWDPQGGKATGYMDARVALNGFHVINDYKQVRNGQTTYEGHGVFGYDPEEKCWTMSWSDGMCPDTGISKGRWEGNTLTFQNQSKMGHGRYTYVFESPEKITFKLEHSQDGKTWNQMMEGKFRKK